MSMFFSRKKQTRIFQKNDSLKQSQKVCETNFVERHFDLNPSMPFEKKFSSY